MIPPPIPPLNFRDAQRQRRMTRPRGGCSERWLSGWILLLLALGAVVFWWRWG